MTLILKTGTNLNVHVILHVSDFNKVLTRLPKISAPSSSNLGVVCCLMGATLVFEESTRRVSCQHFLVMPVSPKMVAWPLFLVNQGTSLQQYK